MKVKIALVVAMLFMLTSCNSLPSFGGNELLEAPLLNQVQQQVYEGLAMTVNPKLMVYKYPATGNYRSPFVFYDLNGDGKDEVVVFYAYKDSEKAVTAQVLEEKEGKWVSFRSLSGKGSYVDFVEFASFTNKEEKNLVIGWGKEGHLEKTVVVYSMGDTDIRGIFTASYYMSYISKEDATGTSQMVLTQGEGAGFQIALYGKLGSGIKQIQAYPLYEETSKILQLLPETEKNGSVFLYVDEELGSGIVSYGTEVFKLTGGFLRLVVGGENGLRPEVTTPEWNAFEDTFRKTKVLSTDLTGDGLVKVPRVKEAEESDKEQPSSITLIEYLRLVENGEFQLKHTTATNQKSGYMLYYPDRWIGNVTIVRDPQREEWRIHKIDESTGEAGTELFRIRVYYYLEYVDEFAKDDILLGTRSLYSYYGTISETGIDPLGISPEEAKDMFALTERKEI